LVLYWITKETPTLGFIPGSPRTQLRFLQGSPKNLQPAFKTQPLAVLREKTKIERNKQATTTNRVCLNVIDVDQEEA